MIGTNGNVYCIFYFTDNIKISHCRFYHYNICAFFNIHQCFLDGFDAVRIIHLVSFFIAKTRGTIKCIPEWAIKAGSIFGAIRHDTCFGKMILFQCFSYGTNPSIHHIARGHDICACNRMAEAHFYQCFYCRVVYNFSV